MLSQNLYDELKKEEDDKIRKLLFAGPASEVALPEWANKTSVEHWPELMQEVEHFFTMSSLADCINFRDILTIPGRRSWKDRVRQIVKSWVTTAAHKIAMKEPPDYSICGDYEGDSGETYLNRWNLLPRNKFCNAYLHEFLRSDYDRHLHDHPWRSVSLCLSGRGREFYQNDPRGSDDDQTIKVRDVKPGDVVYRPLEHAHRIELVEGPLYTIFVTSLVKRKWGFWTESGWVESGEMIERLRRTRNS